MSIVEQCVRAGDPRALHFKNLDTLDTPLASWAQVQEHERRATYAFRERTLRLEDALRKVTRDLERTMRRLEALDRRLRALEARGAVVPE